MSIESVHHVWCSNLPPDERLVALVYADCSDSTGVIMPLSREYLASRTGYSAGEIEAIVRALVKRGALVVCDCGKRAEKHYHISPEISAANMVTNNVSNKVTNNVKHMNHMNHIDHMISKNNVVNNMTRSSEPCERSEHGSDISNDVANNVKHIEQVKQVKDVSNIVTNMVTTAPSDGLSERVAEEPEVVKRKRSERQEVLAQLENFFAEITRLPLPKRDTKRAKKGAYMRWWGPLYEFYEIAGGDIDKTKRIIRDAVDYMRNERLTIASPQSIEKIYLDKYATSYADGGAGSGIW